MNYLSTKKVSELVGCCIKTAQRWAVKNGVKSEGFGARKTFFWTQKNIEDFKNRNRKVGRHPQKKA